MNEPPGIMQIRTFVARAKLPQQAVAQAEQDANRFLATIHPSVVHSIHAQTVYEPVFLPGTNEWIPGHTHVITVVYIALEAASEVHRAS